MVITFSCDDNEDFKQKIFENSVVNTDTELIHHERCIDWMGSVNRYGYPVIWDSSAKKVVTVCRLAYQIVNKDIYSKNRYIRQRCNRKLCINEKHLYMQPSSLQEKFLAYTRINMDTLILNGSRCIDWQLSTDKDGYGKTKNPETGQTIGVHRVSFELFSGPIPEGEFVLHLCHRPICCNPRHLKLGTHQDNMDDMSRAGRSCSLKGELSPSCKYSDKIIEEIRYRRDNEDITQRELSRIFGMSHQHVSDIINGKYR